MFHAQRRPGAGLKRLVSLSTLGLLVLILASATVLSAAASTGSPWTTYMDSIRRQGYTSDGAITTANAANLAMQWSYTASPKLQYNSIFAQPIYSSGKVYFGSFDGYEYSFDTSGNMLWRSYLGRTVDNVQCNPPQVGVASTGTLANTTIKGKNYSVLYVGGGDARMYALDAANGATLWAATLTTVSPGPFIWSSPAVYNGSVYIGMASFGDCPLVQGQVFKLNAKDGSIQAVFNVVPNGCTGGSVWSAPAIDAATGKLFVTTGNPGTCSQPEPLAIAFLELNASDLSYVASWAVPPSQLVPDSDFGATTTFFQDANGRPLVGAANKNGIFYALPRDYVPVAGGPAWQPVWQQQIGVGGDCPQCGTAVIAPAAFDGAHLFTGSGQSTINGQACDGTARELDPTTGQFIWQHCFIGGNAKYPASVLGAVTVTPNVVVVGAGTSVFVLDKSNGATLFQFNTHQVSSSFQPSFFWGSSAVSGGTIFAGNMDGTFYQLGLPGQ